jgi:anti-sigma regulatory factor (Ser/Thr protein kinase)
MSSNAMLTLTSDPKNIARVETFVEGLVAKYQISPDVYGNILISLTEAVTNAIIHGNHKDISKRVCVKLKKQKDLIAFMVSDEGGGFDFDCLPDPTSPENLLKLGGRGVFLMRQLSDDIVFSENGSTVEIRFNI